MIDVLHTLSAGYGSILGLLTGGLMGPVSLLVACLIMGYPLYVLGQRANHATPWFGFIPILNIVLLVQLADLEIFWVILCFIPFVGLYPWYKVAEKQGKNGLVVLGFFIPCIGIFVPYYIVFM